MQHLKVLKGVFKNTGWNLLGLALPLIIAIFSIPMLIKNVGLERFGMLSLIWVGIGYFALFDLGLGRAVTKVVSELDIDGDKYALESVSTTTLIVAGLISCLGGLVLAALVWGVPSIVDRAPLALRLEVRDSSLWVAACIPVVVLTAVLKGILEGGQRFRALNLIRGPTGALMFLLPALGSIYTPSLTLAVAMTVVARVLMLVAHYLPCRNLVSFQGNGFSMHWVKPLFAFGGWFTVANLVSPIIVYLDRFFLALLLPLANLAFYTAPFEVVSKVLNIPAAITSALFPALNKMNVVDASGAAKLRKGAQMAVLLIMLGVVFCGVAASASFISVWLGDAFVEQSAPVMRWLLVGFGINSLAQVTYIALQSEGQVKAVACLQLVELPFYALLLWGLITVWGIQGAAIAWAIRSAVDWMLLEFILYKVLKIERALTV